ATAAAVDSTVAKHSWADRLLRFDQPLEMIRLRAEDLVSPRMRRPKSDGIYPRIYTPQWPRHAPRKIHAFFFIRRLRHSAHRPDWICSYCVLACWYCNDSIV